MHQAGIWLMMDRNWVESKIKWTDHIATLMMDSFAIKIMVLIAILTMEKIAHMQVTMKLFNLDNTALHKIQ
jgi:hypothetical protein